MRMIRMVLAGRVREVDRLGNDAADEAADYGRRGGWSCCHRCSSESVWGLLSMVTCSS